MIELGSFSAERDSFPLISLVSHLYFYISFRLVGESCRVDKVQYTGIITKQIVSRQSLPQIQYPNINVNI